jgi:hypothetical protein
MLLVCSAFWWQDIFIYFIFLLACLLSEPASLFCNSYESNFINWNFNNIAYKSWQTATLKLLTAKHIVGSPHTFSKRFVWIVCLLHIYYISNITFYNCFSYENANNLSICTGCFISRRNCSVAHLYKWCAVDCPCNSFCTFFGCIIIRSVHMLYLSF